MISFSKDVSPVLRPLLTTTPCTPIGWLGPSLLPPGSAPYGLLGDPVSGAEWGSPLLPRPSGAWPSICTQRCWEASSRFEFRALPSPLASPSPHQGSLCSEAAESTGLGVRGPGSASPLRPGHTHSRGWVPHFPARPSSNPSLREAPRRVGSLEEGPLVEPLKLPLVWACTGEGGSSGAWELPPWSEGKFPQSCQGWGGAGQRPPPTCRLLHGLHPWLLQGTGP